MQLLQQLGVIPGWEEPLPVPPAPTPNGGPATSVEENKAIMTGQLPIWNDGDYDLADELFHPDAVTPTRRRCRVARKAASRSRASSGRPSRTST